SPAERPACPAGRRTGLIGSQPHPHRGPEMKEPARVTWRALPFPQSEYQLTKASRIPAATAEPITPATFGPMACISRKFCGLDSSPTLFETRAAIGTADTPADPIRGLILCWLNRFISLAISTPAAV